jgi:murein DD-endopeptidase MepM/ murein hydrolase activator NlpD
LANRKRTGWKILLIPEDESNVRQFRLPRKAVMSLVGIFVLIIIYAAIETTLFWSAARRAAQVEPLKRKVRELENSSAELNRLGTELTRLKGFEQQLRRVLSGKNNSNSSENLPWDNGDYNQLPGESTTNQILEAQKSSESPVREAKSVGTAAYTAMDVPTLPPVRGYVTRHFTNPGLFNQNTHYGLDVAARVGTPVLAAADGQVLFADWTYQYGNYVVITHRSGYISFYGHNQVLLVRPGERVRQGQPIALLGNSGVSTAPHVHFELWQDGSPIDPMSLLASAP